MKPFEQVCCGLGIVLGLAAVSVAGSPGYRGVTTPSETVTLSFLEPGKVLKVAVRPGDRVQAGAVLIRQDDRVQQVQLKQLKAEAENRVRIQAAEKQLAQRKVDRDRLRELVAKGGLAAKSELEQAELDVEISALSLQLSEFEKQQAMDRYEEARRKLEHLTITSPINAVVVDVAVSEGQAVDRLEPAIRLVAIEPLWVDTHVPLATARELPMGAPADVTFADESEIGRGKVIFKSPVADMGVATLLVRVELPNPERRPAGERVTVVVPAAETPVATAPQPKAAATPTTQPAPAATAGEVADAAPDRP